MVVPNGFRKLSVVGVGALVALASLGSLGCGSSSTPQLGDTVANRLQRSLDEVRQGASSHDRARALSGLSRFSRLVARESRAGHLSAADARALRTGIAQARRRIELEIEPRPAAVPAPAPQGAQESGPGARPEAQKNEGAGEDKDKAKDEEKDRGDEGKGKGKDEGKGQDKR